MEGCIPSCSNSEYLWMLRLYFYFFWFCLPVSLISDFLQWACSAFIIKINYGHGGGSIIRLPEGMGRLWAMIMESQCYKWLLGYKANLCSILPEWFSTCIPLMAHSLLSQPIPYAFLWLPHSGGSTLWSCKFWVFAIASYQVYLLLLPCYNISSTKWSSKKLSPIMPFFCSEFTFQFL